MHGDDAQSNRLKHSQTTKNMNQIEIGSETKSVGMRNSTAIPKIRQLRSSIFDSTEQNVPNQTSAKKNEEALPNDVKSLIDGKSSTD